jgi:uncharacterized membrane protein YphA (DoxX/SURF4 family)
MRVGLPRAREDITNVNILLWVLQVLLAAAFLAHGLMFLFPSADMAAAMNASIPPALRYFIGVAEVLAAIGLTLPGLTRIRPSLVPAAAAGLIIVMIGAVSLHSWRGEVSAAITTATLLVLVTFVAYARWKVRPILPRTPAPVDRATAR